MPLAVADGVLDATAECIRWVGTPAPVEGQRLAWARAPDLEAFPMPPADVPLLPAVRAAMASATRCAQGGMGSSVSVRVMARVRPVVKFGPRAAQGNSLRLLSHNPLSELALESLG